MGFFLTTGGASPGRVLRDIKALGTSAPLRAGYEASKRSNFHRVLFRDVDPASVPRSVVLELGSSVPDGPVARQRCLSDARLILEQGIRVFGRRCPTGSQGPWSIDPLTQELWSESAPWWQIDIRTERRLSDVKFVWEAGRHRDLVVLARAAVLDPDGPWMAHLTVMLERWMIQCRPERGVHWYSSLELALRAISWAQVISLVGERLSDSVRSQMDHQLMASAQHILLELPYTVSSMKNNHMLGDGLGLVVLGTMFPEKGRRWRRIGDRLMLAQLRRHMHSDGSMIEDSLSYHRFVLEMFIIRHLLGNSPPEIEEALEGAALHLSRMGVLDGQVPQYGDWDEGRVLADSAEAGSTAGTTLAALALSGYRVAEESFDKFDELAWYLGPVEGGRALPAVEQGCVSAGTFVRLQAGDWRIWFKTGVGLSHQHADVSSVWIMRNDRWLTKDPGTGTYNGPLKVRNGLRASSAHPVWVPAGEDQLIPHRAFRWLRSIGASQSNVGQIGDCTAVLAVHDAFAETHGRVARTILVSPTGVTVVDSVERPGGVWTMSLPLGDSEARKQFYGLGEETLYVGEEDPWLGWHSSTYGTWDKSAWLVTQHKFESAKRWGVGEPSSVEVRIKWNFGSVEADLHFGDEKINLRAIGEAYV